MSKESKTELVGDLSEGVMKCHHCNLRGVGSLAQSADGKIYAEQLPVGWFTLYDCAFGVRFRVCGGYCMEQVEKEIISFSLPYDSAEDE